MGFIQKIIYEDISGIFVEMLVEIFVRDFYNYIFILNEPRP